MRVVLDANIYVSALISAKGNPAKIVQRWLNGEFDILLSEAIVDEILRVTAYEHIQKKYPRVKENRVEFVELLSEQGIFVEPTEVLDLIEDDESDNRYIECAIRGEAQYIISGDEHLLAIGEYKGIVVLTPAGFLTLQGYDRNEV